MPHDAETLYERGDIFTQLAYFALARDAFDEALTLRPNHADTERAQARAHRVMSVVGGVYRWRDWRGTLHLWVERLLDAGLLDEALVATDSSLELHWADSWAYRCRARVLASLGRTEEAQRAETNALWLEGLDEQ